MYLHDQQHTANQGETFLSTANAGQLVNLWTYKTGGPIAAQATVVGNVVYVGSWDGYEYAIDATKGTVIWKTFLGITNVPGCSPPTAGVTSTVPAEQGWR